MRGWVKLNIRDFLFGEFRRLDVGDKAVFFQFLLLASMSPREGIISVTEDIGYTNEQLCSILNVQKDILEKAIENLKEKGLIEVDEQNRIIIKNYMRYALAYTSKDYEARQQKEREREKFEDLMSNDIYVQDLLSYLHQIGFPRKTLKSEYDRRELFEIFLKCDADEQVMLEKFKLLVNEKERLREMRVFNLKWINLAWDRITSDKYFVYNQRMVPENILKQSIHMVAKYIVKNNIKYDEDLLQKVAKDYIIANKSNMTVRTVVDMLKLYLKEVDYGSQNQKDIQAQVNENESHET